MRGLETKKTPTAPSTSIISKMIARSACPDCLQNHAILAPVTGRSVVRCTHCRRFWPPGEHSDAGPDAQRCNDHPGRSTRGICRRCDLTWCEPCGGRVRVQGFNTTLSPCCREGLDPVAEIKTILPYWAELPAMLRYAFRGGSPFVLLFLFLGGYVPILSLTIPFFATAYGVHVIRYSSSDPYTAPGFPESDDVLVAFLYPLLRLLGASLVAGFPWYLYDRFGTANPIVQTLFLVLGLSIYPAIVLNATIQNRFFSAIVPTELWRTVRLMGVDYLALVAALGIFILVWKATSPIAYHEILEMPVWYGRFYLLITMFHVFGRSVWQTRHRIDWGV